MTISIVYLASAFGNRDKRGKIGRKQEHIAILKSSYFKMVASLSIA
jgi:hypothetical protein